MATTTVILALAVSHVIVPWLVLARRLRKDRLLEAPPPGLGPPAEARKTKKRRKATLNEAARTAKHVANLCRACGAPAPLTDETAECAHCSAKIVPPPDVAAAYRRVIWAKRALSRAEDAWRTARRWCAPGWVALFVVVVTAWSLVYLGLVIAASSRQPPVEWSSRQLLLIMAAGPSGAYGWAIGVWLGIDGSKLGRALGKLPRGLESLPARSVPCSHCGAAVDFAEGHFGVICTYCGSEEIRPTLARHAAKEADELHAASSRSMIEAHRAVASRRESLLKYLDYAAAFQVVFVLYHLGLSVPVLGDVLRVLGEVGSAL
jgi:DNA-directed RNA polymerase subunit RPC12/RpoP